MYSSFFLVVSHLAFSLSFLSPPHFFFPPPPLHVGRANAPLLYRPVSRQCSLSPNFSKIKTPCPPERPFPPLAEIESARHFSPSYGSHNAAHAARTPPNSVPSITSPTIDHPKTHKRPLRLFFFFPPLRPRLLPDLSPFCTFFPFSLPNSDRIPPFNFFRSSQLPLSSYQRKAGC